MEREALFIRQSLEGSELYGSIKNWTLLNSVAIVFSWNGNFGNFTYKIGWHELRRNFWKFGYFKKAVKFWLKWVSYFSTKQYCWSINWAISHSWERCNCRTVTLITCTVVYICISAVFSVFQNARESKQFTTSKKNRRLLNRKKSVPVKCKKYSIGIMGIGTSSTDGTLMLLYFYFLILLESSWNKGWLGFLSLLLLFACCFCLCNDENRVRPGWFVPGSLKSETLCRSST